MTYQVSSDGLSIKLDDGVLEMFPEKDGILFHYFTFRGNVENRKVRYCSTEGEFNPVVMLANALAYARKFVKGREFRSLLKVHLQNLIFSNYGNRIEIPA